MKRATLTLVLVGIALAAGCGSDPSPPPSEGCAPECRIGFVCVARTCVSACTPPCGAAQTCVTRDGSAFCDDPTRDAAIAPEDTGADAMLEASADAAPDIVTTDVPASDLGADQSPSDAARDDAPTTDVPGIDAPRDATVEASVADAGRDAPADVVTIDAATDRAVVDAPIDVSIDTPRDAPGLDATPEVGVDAAVDRPDVAADVPCGAAGQPCCLARVCVGAAVCDTTVMRCQAFTPVPDECTSTLRCTGGDVCGGIYLCGSRPCLLCVMPGTRALGSACTTADQCASVFCTNGVCSAPCPIGPTGDTTCASMMPGSICGQFTSRARADAGVGALSVFGACLLACTRDGACGTGNVCRLQRNDYFDRLDTVCATPAGLLAPGAPCDPNPSGTITAAVLCGNNQCIPTAEHAGYCSPFCVTDADCPSTAYACIGFTFGRPSGATQVIRQCVRR